MYKLHVKTDQGFKPVFCNLNGRVVTTDCASKALPSNAAWAQDDLKWFQSKFSDLEFKLIRGTNHE